MEISRRDFIGATAAAAVVAASGSVASALASESSSSTATAPEGGVEFLYSRTTLHSDYDTTKPLSDEDISLILNAAFSAPTGGDQRAIDFFPVTDPEILAKIGAAHKNYGAPQTAPFVVIIAKVADRVYYPELLNFDAGLAAGAMLVQAAALGITTCCMSIAPQCDREFQIMQALNLPYKTLNDPMYEPLLMVAFGYPTADTEASASVFNYDDAQVHMNGFTADVSATVEAAEAELQQENWTTKMDMHDSAAETIADVVLGN